LGGLIKGLQYTSHMLKWLPMGRKGYNPALLQRLPNSKGQPS
jgi:hypothetical protein